MKSSSFKPNQLRARLGKRVRRQFSRAEIGTSPTRITTPIGASQTQIRLVRYTAEEVVEHDLNDATYWDERDDLRWVDISGLKDHDLIVDVCNRLNLHSLTIADLFHTDQRPKAEVSADYVQIVLRMPVGGPPFEADQLTIISGRNFVLSVREHSHDQFDPVRNRMQAGGSRICSSSAYLAYALIDLVIDSYFPILERYGDITENLEEHILSHPQDGVIRDIHLLKRELLDLRHALWPLREAVNALLREDVLYFEERLKPYLRGCAEHAFQLLDMVEVYREVAQGLVDLHLSSLSNRMNEVMKVLTIIATLFIPMTFIVGLYGMNFDRSFPLNLPELGWRYGYLFALGLMATSAGTMLILFYKLGWLFKKKPPNQD